MKMTMEQLAALSDQQIMEMSDVEIDGFPRHLYETSHLRSLLAEPDLIYDLSEQAFGLDDFDLYSTVRVSGIDLSSDPAVLSVADLDSLEDEDIMETKASIEIQDLPRDVYGPAYEAWRQTADEDVIEALETVEETTDFGLYAMVRINGITLAPPAPSPMRAFG